MFSVKTTLIECIS
uniref:Uncharacterized protein n=1 Tax=Anguilla anguilla TaxID=7936 RepID=A0A0E9TCI5_ANGAN